jgi:DNA-directed RNA polymerase subunit RPC12/RpoP
MNKFILYLLRWQASSLILAPVIAIVNALFTPNVDWNTVAWFGTLVSWIGAISANLIGGCIFFWVDKFIFTSTAVEMWHIIPEGNCYECSKKAPLWRLTLAPGYDKREDRDPEYLCMECSKKRTAMLRNKGIKIRGKSK